MTMREELLIREAGRSAHEINRRVRRIERDRLLSGVTPWSGREAGGAAWGYGTMVGENAQTKAVPVATVSRDKRIALTGGGRSVERVSLLRAQ